MPSVHKRTIPTERPPLVSEVSANFLRIEGATWSAWRIPTAVFSDFYTGAATIASKLLLNCTQRGWVDTVPDPLIFFGSAGNRTRYLWICSQELWPLDHRGGPYPQETKQIRQVFLHNVLRYTAIYGLPKLLECVRCDLGHEGKHLSNPNICRYLHRVEVHIVCECV
jgi:hypothetical protein